MSTNTNTSNDGQADRIATLEAEVARLRAEVDDLRERLAAEGLSTCAREDALEGLMGAGLIRYWNHHDDDTLTVAVHPGGEAKVREALCAVGAHEIGQRASRTGLSVLLFSTSGEAP